MRSITGNFAFLQELGHVCTIGRPLMYYFILSEKQQERLAIIICRALFMPRVCCLCSQITITCKENIYLQCRSQPKNLGRAKKCGGAKMFDFRRITLFCLEKRPSKPKMTMFSKYLGGGGPSGPLWLRLCILIFCSTC